VLRNVVGYGRVVADLSHKHRRLLALAIVAVAMAFALPRFLTHTPYQRLGVRLDWNTPSQNPRVTSVVGPPGKGCCGVTT